MKNVNLKHVCKTQSDSTQDSSYEQSVKLLQLRNTLLLTNNSKGLLSNTPKLLKFVKKNILFFALFSFLNTSNSDQDSETAPKNYME